MSRHDRIIGCAAVALVATMLGACGSSSTSTSAKPSRRFTPLSAHIDIHQFGNLRSDGGVDLLINYSCPRLTSGTTGGRIATDLRQLQYYPTSTIVEGAGGSRTVTCDSNTHSISVVNEWVPGPYHFVGGPMNHANATLYQNFPTGPDTKVAETSQPHLTLTSG